MACSTALDTLQDNAPRNMQGNIQGNIWNNAQVIIQEDIQGNINQNYKLYFYDALIVQHCRAFNMLWIIKSKVNLDKLKAYRAMVSEMSEEQKVLLPARSCMLAVTL